ncbi:MAG: hypothetical protein ACQEVA_07300 [Myxococcota bacterium]
MYRSFPMATRAVVVVLAVLFTAGCASGDITDKTGNNGDSDAGSDAVDASGDDAVTDSGDDGETDATDATDTSDTSDTPDGQDTGDADATDGDDGSDASLELAYDVCVLNDAAPWDECDTTGRLNFGPVADGETVTRLARLDNIGDEPFDITAADIASSNFDVRILTYSTDDPPQESEETLPFLLEAGQSVFFEVTVTGASTSGPLDADVLAVSMEQNGIAAPDEEIELVGGFTGCAGDTADCDGDPSNGCEVDLSTSPDNCGTCGNTCSDVNGTSTCDAGSCVITCDASYGDCDSDPLNGCEEDLSAIPNCGACGEDCSLPNATSTCDEQACSFQACDPGYADCDNDPQANGCEINTEIDLRNCGACGSICDYPFASETCTSGQCEFQGCDTDRHDLNNDLSDGCEYACTKTSNSDDPDINGVDANCDGIDGEVIRAIFVAKSGDDSNPGSPDQPLLTIAEALSTATSTSGLDHIYVSRGLYEEQVTLANGVSIYGGYAADQGWTRRNTFVTKIYNDGTAGQPPVAVKGSGLSNTTTVDLLTIESGSASGDGVSSYGLHCTDCSKLVVSNSNVVAGNGSAGTDGSNGESGLSAFGRGYSGGGGGSGSCDGSGWGSGGSGGNSGCGRGGGSGGRGGSKGDNDGYNGSNGIYSSPGGSGGGGGDPGGDGGNGASGTNGSSGSNGSGGSSTTIVNGFWQANDGVDGSNGTHGNGGSGGGGGGGQGCFFCINGSGNGGGGGGGGGCGGVAGQGGTAGGGSFGIFLIDSSGVTLENNVVTSGNGGNGGDGGSGGSGSSGGSGGLGDTYCSGEIGEGGNGGSGGAGGNGGHGGGGRGGDSISVFRQNTTVSLPGTNTLRVGNAGTGGSSSGAAGADGEARTN